MCASRGRRRRPRRQAARSPGRSRAGGNRGSEMPAGRGRARARRRLPPSVERYPQRVTDLLRVACVQMTSRADKAANLEQAERLVARAAATGADVVALPEKWN